MATTSHERVGKVLDLLRRIRAGLGPFVDREVKGTLKARGLDTFRGTDQSPAIHPRRTPWTMRSVG